MPKKSTTKKTEDKPIKKPNSAKRQHLLKGFKDILPEAQPYWRYVRNVVESFVDTYTYKEIGLPIVESASLFIRGVGKQSDIVQKEMFTFEDHDESVVLRPEATASIARAYIEHGMMTWPQPVKLYYWGPMFRREKPQAGRYRQFYQFGFESLGQEEPVVDARMISIAYQIFQELKLSNVAIQLNSIGDPEEREEYTKELTTYYRSKRRQLCEDCKKRITKNPLRLLDCKELTCQPLRQDAPQILDWLGDASKEHFMKVVEYLDELEIPYNLNPHLVRGLDYYNRTLFEIWPQVEEGGSQSALGGGGRYDGLVEALGGQPTAACGFSVGVDRVIREMRNLEVKIGKPKKPQVFIAQIGHQAKIKAMRLFQQFQKQGIRAVETFSKDKLKAQLEAANKLGVKYVLILGQKEVVDGTILIRDMEGGAQEVVNFDKITEELKRKLNSK
ncbi:MAG: histidine--tRNA ligase [Candidatus Buchananbacteria bacterium CG10_big_fil_rev_8_21_14_0_10_42_9]|uniref:Histidine--tRNA ligase n=1 Tax=Candidatus Buchananbacteria bacterium CG10_big_fil_rev_8_21_14_0_10_42_9 TaxID=1974526 RepID=A0A2H0W0Y7_9BACT|nr:MAG: histidine--tRNA ligase [Candidatus Buchananbacteria bacterium CG10_big_fil_rev_8_21_14_0_10_42_9]